MFPIIFQTATQILWAMTFLLAAQFAAAGIFPRGFPFFKYLGRDLLLLSGVTALPVWFDPREAPTLEWGLFLFLFASLHTGAAYGLSPAWSRKPWKALAVLACPWTLMVLVWRWPGSSHPFWNLVAAQSLLFTGLAGLSFYRWRKTRERKPPRFGKFLSGAYLVPGFTALCATLAAGRNPTLALGIWLAGLLIFGALAVSIFAEHLVGLFVEQEKLLLQTTEANEAMEQERPLQELGRHTARVSRDIRGITAQLRQLGQRLRPGEGGPEHLGLSRIERARGSLERYTQGILDYAASFNVQLNPPREWSAWLHENLGAACAAQALRLHYFPPGEEMWVRFDPVFLRKSLAQICLNAKEAGATTLNVLVQSSGPNAEILIEDDGRGCDPERVDQFKTPFYTTKKNAGACGLGLSMAETIVQGHGGMLHVQAHGGPYRERGFWVVMVLPLAEAESAF